MQTDQSTLQYLKQNVGDILSNAIAEAICRKPENAAKFIGQYLLDHCEQNQQQKTDKQ